VGLLQTGTKTMRRTAAAAMVVSFLVAVLLPLLAVADVPSLPACCRRDGAHHCAMMAKMAHAGATTAPALRTVLKLCPFRSALAAGGTQLKWYIPAALPLALSRKAQPLEERKARARIAAVEIRAHPKRGPPFCFWFS
jgi:hypothetical protein